MNIHDVFRHLVRRVGAHDEGQLRDLLLAVDADEQGYDSLETYKVELAAQAESKGQQDRADSEAEDQRVIDRQAAARQQADERRAGKTSTTPAGKAT